jgi:hypothetical protein
MKESICALVVIVFGIGKFSDSKAIENEKTDTMKSHTKYRCSEIPPRETGEIEDVV